MNTKKVALPKSVAIWLLIGVLMVFAQVIIGGITRLTDSGLSITEWDVVKGTLPPLNEVQWAEAFEKYKTHAATQFNAIHRDMTLGEFKYIYFWEYFHRLWARSMGFVFLFPFLYFWRKGYLTRAALKDLGVVVVLAGVVATFGWIMVASGLNTPDYAWVNAYKLTAHLTLAVLVFGYLLWVCFKTWQPATVESHNRRLSKYAWRITYVLILQIVLGGMMSGMKAGLFFNEFPYMQLSPTGKGIWIAEVLKEKHQWTWENMLNYQKNAFAPALIQMLHRSTAYLLCILLPMLFFTVRRTHMSFALNFANWSVLMALFVQVGLGVWTLVSCVGKVPATLGVLHQGGALVLLAAMLYLNYQFSKGGYWLTSPNTEKEA
jgi:cytochrome c oxidase assembly protein subunit 15